MFYIFQQETQWKKAPDLYSHCLPPPERSSKTRWQDFRSGQRLQRWQNKTGVIEVLTSCMPENNHAILHATNLTVLPFKTLISVTIQGNAIRLIWIFSQTKCMIIAFIHPLFFKFEELFFGTFIPGRQRRSRRLVGSALTIVHENLLDQKKTKPRSTRPPLQWCQLKRRDKSQGWSSTIICILKHSYDWYLPFSIHLRVPQNVVKDVC